MVAIGNGTASRESRAVIIEQIKQVLNTVYAIVNEAGRFGLFRQRYRP